MSLVYYIVLGVTAVSYLLGLFLSYCEKRGRVAILSDTMSAGYIGVFSGDPEEMIDEVEESEKPMMYQQGISIAPEQPVIVSYMDDEIL